MSVIAYHVTKDVRHLSVWTADCPSETQRRYRPVCGAAISGRLESTNVFVGDAACEYAFRRPICKRCVDVAAWLGFEAQS
jgi:hypothetical protein